MPFKQALIWGTIVPYLFLPEAFRISLPALPDLGKMAAVGLGLLIIFVVNRSRLAPPPAESEAPLLRFLLLISAIMILTAPLLTVLNNQETLRFGPTEIPGLSVKEGLAQAMLVVLMLVPYYFGRRYLASPEAHQKLLLAIVVMGLIYSALMLVEMRLSPQLHRWVYGFHPHIFAMHIRDGYRPMMFLQHGLFVGFFMFTCVMAALGLWKAGQGVKFLGAALWFFFILYMSRNLGATVVAVLVVGVYLGLGRWIHILFAMSIGVTVFFYPIFRSTGLMPVEEISAAAALISERRALSLNFRLVNEDIALARALEKPVTGWGRWGRNQVYDEQGQVVSVQEGAWIQAITENGWYGYIGLYALLTLPAMFAIGVWRRKKIPPETFALIGITTGNLIYSIPTTCLTPVGVLVFGALAGFMLTKPDTDKEEADQGQPVLPVSPYTRFARDHVAVQQRSAGGEVR